MDDIVRMYEDMNPDIIIHLAAVVGAIGQPQMYLQHESCASY